ncbi:nucleotidyltransferase domain-containing protein [Microbacterium sp. KUDC0406]|uniref:nucleotidyltransferase family protein n=1 Tax=Microbacterium sp. KUDC0406 TaxID=2909588 RepID=UPI001F4865A2|nr:nucleotidyltransferase domain-containing protein [Microbacterium sp. KUDC0406]UJP09372.1 nucleotidyltransferase domain-containing protein [Microbacterium sp. KUDC0406]
MPILRYRELLDAQPQNVVTLERLRKLKPVIERLAGAAGLEDVRVYGSVARGQAGPDSDVDLLVTPGGGVTLFDLAQFEMDMEVLLQLPVSVISINALDAERDTAILSDAVRL